jgi:tetratricopeptide (TPR) repeat protein
MMPPQTIKYGSHKRFLKKSFAGLYLLMFSLTIQAQDYSLYRIVDSITYHYYEAEQWPALVNAGRQSLKQGHDYAYLRMRLGIAYYMLGQYRLAAHHFEQALDFDSRNANALLLLQNSYRWGGMESSAANLTKRFPTKPHHYSKQNFLKEVSVFSGKAFSGIATDIKDLDLMEPGQNYAEMNANGDIFYFNAGLKISPARHFVWYLGFTGLQLRKHQLILHRFADTISHQYILRQHQLYLSLPFVAGNNWEISPAAAIIAVNQNPVVLMYDTLLGRLRLDTVQSRLNNYVVSIKAYRHFPRVGTGASLSYANLNDNKQVQAGFYFDLFPFGNQSLYTNSALYLVQESRDFRPHFKQSLGFMVSPRLWLQMAYTAGEVKNMNFENGMIVYNSTATLKSRLSADVFVLLNQHLSLQVQYAWQKQYDEYVESFDFDTFAKKTYEYSNHQLMLGLKWKL